MLVKALTKCCETKGEFKFSEKLVKGVIMICDSTDGSSYTFTFDMTYQLVSLSQHFSITQTSTEEQFCGV